jgi:hypothetical protein
LPISYIDIFRPDCDAIDCSEGARYERKITVRNEKGGPFTFTAFFCEIHKDNAKTPWDEYHDN